MNEDIILSIISANEPITVTYIEPFDFASALFGYDFASSFTWSLVFLTFFSHFLLLAFCRGRFHGRRHAVLG